MISPDFSSHEPADDLPDAGPQLDQYTGNVPWSYLAPHCKKGSLYFVDASLNLQEVGEAISTDNATTVDNWLKRGDLVKMGALHAAQWKDADLEFEALVISPFVLCRPS